MDIIGQAIAGNNRLSDGRTLLEKYPEKYSNVLTDWVALLIAESKARLSLEQISEKGGQTDMPKYKNRNAGDEAYTTRVRRKGKTGKAVNKSTSRNTKKKG